MLGISILPIENSELKKWTSTSSLEMHKSTNYDAADYQLRPVHYTWSHSIANKRLLRSGKRRLSVPEDVQNQKKEPAVNSLRDQHAEEKGLRSEYLKKLVAEQHKLLGSIFADGHYEIREPFVEIDMCFNKKLEPENCASLGKFMSVYGYSSLRAIDCNFTDEKLKRFFDGFTGDKFKKLDISCSTNLTLKGFETLATFVKVKKVEILNLSGCQLTNKILETINKKLPKGLTFAELDLSCNPDLEPAAYKTLSLMMLKYNIGRISIASCSLKMNCLEQLRTAEGATIKTMDMGDNPSFGDGITNIAEFVRKNRIGELNLGDCMFSTSQLKMFNNALQGKTIPVLHLSDYDRTPDEEYLEEVCNLLPVVTDILYLQFKSLNAALPRLLQDELNKLEKRATKIVLTTGTITWQKTSKNVELTKL